MLIFELQLKVKNAIKLNYEKLNNQNGNKTYREMITYATLHVLKQKKPLIDLGK